MGRGAPTPWAAQGTNISPDLRPISAPPLARSGGGDGRRWGGDLRRYGVEGGPRGAPTPWAAQGTNISPDLRPISAHLRPSPPISAAPLARSGGGDGRRWGGDLGRYGVEGGPRGAPTPWAALGTNISPDLRSSPPISAVPLARSGGGDGRRWGGDLRRY